MFCPLTSFSLAIKLHNSSHQTPAQIYYTYPAFSNQIISCDPHGTLAPYSCELCSLRSDLKFWNDLMLSFPTNRTIYDIKEFMAHILKPDHDISYYICSIAYDKICDKSFCVASSAFLPAGGWGFHSLRQSSKIAHLHTELEARWDQTARGCISSNDHRRNLLCPRHRRTRPPEIPKLGFLLLARKKCNFSVYIKMNGFEFASLGDDARVLFKVI